MAKITTIQIQHLLKLNYTSMLPVKKDVVNSNTTLVKVKYYYAIILIIFFIIQIQHLLKLNGLSVEEYRKKCIFKYNTC